MYIHAFKYLFQMVDTNIKEKVDLTEIFLKKIIRDDDLSNRSIWVSTWNHIKFIVEAWSMDADYAEDPRICSPPLARERISPPFPPSLEARPRWLLPPFTGPSWKLAVAFCVRRWESKLPIPPPPPSLLTPMIDHFDLIIGYTTIASKSRKRRNRRGW